MKRSFLALPAVATVGALLAAPMAVLFIYSLWKVGFYSIVHDWNIHNYTDAFTRDASIIGSSVEIGFIVASISTILAVPFAYAVRFKLGRAAQNTALFLILIALFGGYLVRIYAWKTILGDTGVVNSGLQAVGFIHQPLQILLFSRFTVIVAMTNFFLPVAVLPIYGALQNLPRERIDASHDLGAGRISTAARLVIPEIAPAIWAGFALCMVLGSGDWITPALLGGSSNLMVGQVVAEDFGATYNWPAGSALAFASALTVAGVIGIVGVGAWWVARHRRGTVGA